MNHQLTNAELLHLQRQFAKIKANLDKCKTDICTSIDRLSDTLTKSFDFCLATLQFVQEKSQSPDSSIPIPQVSLHNIGNHMDSKSVSRESSISSNDYLFDSSTPNQDTFSTSVPVNYPIMQTQQPNFQYSINNQAFEAYWTAYLSGDPIPIDTFNREQIYFIRDKLLAHNYRLPPDLDKYFETLKIATIPSVTTKSLSVSSSSSQTPTLATTASLMSSSSTAKRSDFAMYREKRPCIEKIEDLIIPENAHFKKYLIYYKNHKSIFIDACDIDKIEAIKSEFLSLGLRESSIWHNIYLNTYFPNSSILSNDQAFFVSNWCGSTKQWKLAYKGTRDGFLSDDFHSRCDNKGESVTLFKYYVNGVFCVFGGYTSISWTSDDQHFSDPHTFVFTLSNPNNIPPTQYPCILKSKNCYHGKHLGPNFGGTYNNMGICGAYQQGIPPAIQPKQNKIYTLAIVANNRYYSFVNFNHENPTYGDFNGYGNGLFVSQGKTWNHISFTSNEIETFIRSDA